MAHAAAPIVSVRLDVQAPPECTSQADLTTRILARLRRDIDDDTAALAVRARFTALPSGNIVADLTLTKPGAKPSSRRLVARSCEQAADAAALIVAVTLDPTSVSESATTIEVKAESNGSSREFQNSLADAPPGAVPRGAQTQPNRELPGPGPASIVLDPSENGAGWAAPAWTGTPRFGAQITAQLIGGVAPKLMPSIAVYAMAGLDREGLGSPALILGATHGFDASVEATGGTADFWLDTVSLDACALRIRLRTLETRVCASALAGRLSASGSETSNTAGIVRRPFAATGAAAIFALRANSFIELTARATGEVNLIRHSFEFAPLVFHTVPRMTFVASVGVGIRSR